MARDNGKRVASYRNNSLLLVLPTCVPMLALSCETSCETGQASFSLQQKLGSAGIRFTWAQQSHVDVYANSSGIKYKRKLQKGQIFASKPCSSPLPVSQVGQVVCHWYMLSNSLAPVM